MDEMERERFDCDDADVEIIIHPDGTLTIETIAETGDSEVGWFTASKTIRMDFAMVVGFREFLERASGSPSTISLKSRK